MPPTWKKYAPITGIAAMPDDDDDDDDDRAEEIPSSQVAAGTIIRNAVDSVSSSTSISAFASASASFRESIKKRESASDSDSNNDPSIAVDENKDCYGSHSQNNNKKKQQQHPYMSLYEPLLFSTEEEEEEVHSQRATKKQKIDYSDSSNKFADHDDDIITDCRSDDDDDDATFDSSDDEVIIHREDDEEEKEQQQHRLNDPGTEHQNVSSSTQCMVERPPLKPTPPQIKAAARSNTRFDYSDDSKNNLDNLVQSILVHKGDDDDDARRNYAYSVNVPSNGEFTRRRKMTQKQWDDANNTIWQEMYQCLVAYKKEHKDTNAPYNYKKDPKLGRWVATQRSKYKTKKISFKEERKHLLDVIGFVWEDPRNSNTWKEIYQRLVAYKKEHENTRVPHKHKEDSKLGAWVNIQRYKYKNKKMTEERVRLLNSIDFEWKLQGRNHDSWIKMYQRLVEYKNEHKDTKVPQNYKEDLKLGRWVSFQRSAYKNKTMTEEHVRLLNSVEFEWKLQERNHDSWIETYQRLVEYKSEHNDTKVPQHYKNDPQLGAWVNIQRYKYKTKNMTEERVRLLNSIAFVCDNTWQEVFQRLVEYKKEHKDTKVPQHYKKDPKLGAWVSTQRYKYKNKKMTEERVRLLNSIDFDWELRQPRIPWKEMFQRLVEHKKEHNNTKVQWKEDPRLGRWVSVQRAAYKSKQLSDEFTRLLNSIDFN